MQSEKKKHGIDTSYLDTNINPANDFYDYACGGWMQAHPLTGEYSSYGMFDDLREKNRKQLRELVEGLSKTPESQVAGTNAQKVSDIYSMAMDMESRNRQGHKPLENQIRRIEGLEESKLVDTIGWLHNGICSVFFSTGVGPDQKNSDLNIMHVGEAGLSLGDRDYYLEKNETNDKIMAAFEVYVKRLMELIGYDTEGQERVWHNVIAIETEIARNKMTREERRDPLKHYNMVSFEDFTAKVPVIDWKRYFAKLGVTPPAELNISSVKYLEALNDWMPKLSLRAIKDYMLYNAVDEATGLLSEDFSEASFQLYGRVMSGKETEEPLWKRAMGLVSSILGEVVGELYVEKYFPEENKKYMLNLVENLRRSLGEHISSLEWMSQPTKEKALEKLQVMGVKIGYPDKWKDYSGIVIDPALSLLENVLNASRWYVNDNYSKLGKKVDKDEWHMTPQTVNAYYSPINNEICFPAGILQAPYFDITADDALNYGAIGVVIGHEMTHGFDDQGRKFDKNGNLTDWWTEEDAEKFNALADILVKQFDSIEVLPGEHANGRYTLGENIADQGGLRVALTAYRHAMKSSVGEHDKAVDDFTNLQRFYIAYAQVWAGNIRDEEISVRTKSDPHSLGRWRVNATLRNIKPFYEAFDIKEGDAMYLSPDERVIIW